MLDLICWFPEFPLVLQPIDFYDSWAGRRALCSLAKIVKNGTNVQPSPRLARIRNNMDKEQSTTGERQQ